MGRTRERAWRNTGTDAPKRKQNETQKSVYKSKKKECAWRNTDAPKKNPNQTQKSGYNMGKTRESAWRNTDRQKKKLKQTQTLICIDGDGPDDDDHDDHDDDDDVELLDTKQGQCELDENASSLSDIGGYNMGKTREPARRNMDTQKKKPQQTQKVRVLTEPGLSVIVSAVLTSRAIFQRMNNYTIYAVSITIRIVLGFMLLALIWRFDFSPFMVLIIAILNDGTIMTISKDKVKPSPLPDSWKLKEIFATGIVLGTYMAVTTVIFFWLAKDSDFFTTAFTSKKDYGRGEREAQWASYQRTLHGLQAPNSNDILSDKTDYRELSELAEQAKRRAEVASKKQKVSGAFSDQSIEQLNDVTSEASRKCVEERMRGLISNLIRLSKQLFFYWADIQKLTSDVRKQIMSMNQKAWEDWEKKQAGADEHQTADKASATFFFYLLLDDDGDVELLDQKQERCELVENVSAVRILSSFLDSVCEVVAQIQSNDYIEKMEQIETRVSDAEAAAIDVTWLRAHLKAINKRKETDKKYKVLYENERKHDFA
ncbi:hypothetical protein SSX86_015446 [Deinandra increscens subsp. villosa]|uniref:Transcription initiation factor TFIID component TAF4 C-terminal domain-containing protein n=1 Tax=Deinandra increscens subsp. villosa TaxID=3103831 RepID=A0AAP0GYX0_9ASTR